MAWAMSDIRKQLLLKHWSVGELLGLHGMMLATVISWGQWHSIPWALLHGALGWLYIIYWAIAGV